MEKKVSIIILTFNSGEFIRETLESVLSQDYDNYELIVGDDCSVDDTVAIVGSYRERFGGRLKLIAGQENEGISRNFNKCLRVCTGEYVFLLGGDDIFLPGKISAQVDFMERNQDVSISYHDVSVFNSSDEKHLYFYNKDRHGFHSGNIEVLLTQGTFNCGCSTAVRNINLPYCDTDIRFASDWLWYMEILGSSGKRTAYFEGVYAKYRRHPGNITSVSKVDCQASEVFLSLDKILKKYPLLMPKYRIACAERGFVFALKYFISGDFRRGSLYARPLWKFLVGAYYFAKRRLFKRVC